MVAFTWAFIGAYDKVRLEVRSPVEMAKYGEVKYSTGNTVNNIAASGYWKYGGGDTLKYMIV